MSKDNEINSTRDFYTYNFESGIMDETNARLANNGIHGQVGASSGNRQDAFFDNLGRVHICEHVFFANKIL